MMSDLKRYGAGRPTIRAAVLALATLGAFLAVLQLVAVSGRNARFEERKRTAMMPLVVERTADGRLRVEEVEVGPSSREVLHPLPAKATGLMAPAGGSDPAPGGSGWRHQWPGAYFEARFEGDSVVMAFDDPRNRYRIALDGGAGPVLVLRPSGSQGVRLSGLGPGPHEVRVDRISESLSGASIFGGFFVDVEGRALPPPPDRDRRIEFIGDSDSVGLGNLSERRDCTGDEVFLLTDTQESFGPRVARHFDADYRLNAASGVTLVGDAREGAPGMRALHGRALIDATAPPDPAAWAPDVIVVALGSNDFASEPAPSGARADPDGFRDDFARQYADFLLELRRQQPQAFLLALAWEEYGSDYLRAHEAALEEARARGEARLDLLVLPAMRKTGCLWHPNLADHEAVAGALIRYLTDGPEVWDD